MSTIVTRATKGSSLTHTEMDANFTNLNTDKQETLISGTTIKTINSTSLLGSGNIDVSVDLTNYIYDNGKSLTANGYQKLSNGLIVQWGWVTTTATTGSATFPITFPTGFLTMTCGMIDASSTSSSTVNVNSMTASGFSWATPAAGRDIGWIAIGH